MKILSARISRLREGEIVIHLNTDPNVPMTSNGTAALVFAMGASNDNDPLLQKQMEIARLIVSALTPSSKTGTQNREYPNGFLMVRATFHHNGPVKPGQYVHQMEFNWNDRNDVRLFAARSDRHIRSGGSTTLECM